MKIADKLYLAIVSCKKVSRLNVSETDFKKWCNTIDGINSLGEDETSFNGRNVSDFKLPCGFDFLLLPSAVKDEVGFKFHNFMEDAQFRLDSGVDDEQSKLPETKEVLSPLNFTMVSMSIINDLRLQTREAQPIERKVASLLSVRDSVVFDNAYVPSECNSWPLIVGFKAYNRIYYNLEVKYFLDEFILDKVVNASK